jgi:hypothetical protein
MISKFSERRRYGAARRLAPVGSIRRDHEYFDIDLELVWTIDTERVPALGAQLKDIADSAPA